METIRAQVDDWVATLNLNQWIISQQVEGLSHDASLLPLPFNGNRMNWVIGHLVEHRDWMLRAVDARTLLPAADADRYRRGSETLTEADEAVSFDLLLANLKQAQETLIATASEASEAFLLEKPQTGLLMPSQKERTRLQRLQSLLWHETYHVGQLELLRQLAATNDNILT